MLMGEIVLFVQQKKKIVQVIWRYFEFSIW